MAASCMDVGHDWRKRYADPNHVCARCGQGSQDWIPPRSVSAGTGGAGTPAAPAADGTWDDAVALVAGPAGGVA